MTIVISEDDAGTKRKTINALEKTRKDIAAGRDITKELDRIWRAIKDDAYNLCPKDTGALANSIRIVKIPTGAMISGWSRIKEVSIYDRSIVAGDITKTNPKTKKPVDYATWVHDGHRMPDGKLFTGVPFLTEAIALHDEDLNKAIQRALKKIGRKYEGN